MTCSSIEFSLAQWLEHLTVVWKVPSGTQNFFVLFLLSTHIIQVIGCAFPFRFPMMNVGMNPFLGQQVSYFNNLSSVLNVVYFKVISQISCTMWSKSFIWFDNMVALAMLAEFCFKL